MTDKDAAIGRKVMVDELNTINSYEAMADHASPKVADVVRDIADEEKVHVGEAGAIIAGHDKRAVPAMKEGIREARDKMGFEEMLKKAVEEKDSEKGYPPMTEAQMLRDPYRHVSMQVNDQLCVNGNRGEHISSEGSVKEADKNDGKSGAYDEDHATASKDTPDDGESGAFDKSVPSFAEMYSNGTGYGLKKACGPEGAKPYDSERGEAQKPIDEEDDADKATPEEHPQ